MATIQNAAISGFLYSEQMKWSRLWFVVYNKFLFQFADKTAQQPQCGMPLSGTVVRLEANGSRPHCFSIRCAGGVVVLAAETDQEATEWVNAINKEIGGGAPAQTPVAQPTSPSGPQPTTPIAQPTPNQPPATNTPQQITQTPPAGNAAPAPQTGAPDSAANDISPETFWSNVFGKLEEAPWPKLVDELSNALGFNLRSEEYYAPFYCIANVVAEGSLTLRNSISRTNFRLFVALFGPLSACAGKCKELIDAGIFHGEITSAEADERLKAVDAVGGYLVRLRKGSRHQIAVAFMDSQKVTKHILLDVNQNSYCIHQLPAVYSSIPKLVFAYRSKFIQAVSYPLMNQFGPNATSANLVGLTQGSSQSSSSSTPRGPNSTPKVNTNVTDVKGMSYAEIEALFSAIATEANTIVSNIPVQIPLGTTEASLIDRGRQLMNDLEIAKKHIIAVAMADKPFLVDPGLGAGPSNAGYLQQILAKVKPNIMCNIRCPIADYQGVKLIPGTCDKRKAVEKIHLRVDVDVEKLGLYLPASGIWTDPSRPLSSYLLVDRDGIDVLVVPEQVNPCIVCVSNTLTGEAENVPIDDHTTIFGLIQAVKKPDPETIAKSGIRIRTAGGSFFCDPTKLCTDYQVGLSIKSVEYGVVSVGEQFVQPKFAPLDKVQPLMAARASPLANVGTVKQLTFQVVETQRMLQALKSGVVPSAAPAPTPSAVMSPAAARTGQPSIAPIAMGSGSFADEDDHTAPKPYNPLPAWQDNLPPTALIRQLLDVPPTPSANGSVVYGTQINIPEGTVANADVISQTKWFMDMAYLGTWWSSMTPEQRRNADNLQRARMLVRNLFEDTSKQTKSKRMALMTESVFSKQQLAAIAQCLSDVATH